MFTILWIVIVFWFGACIGSFLGVLVDRLPFDVPFISSRSICDGCKIQLGWKELIPIVSFLISRGKCRHCKKKISFDLFIIEIVSGISFVVLYLGYYSSSSYLPIFGVILLQFIFSILISCSLIVIFFTDAKYGIIPDQVLIFMTAIGFFLNILNNHSLLVAVLSGFFTFLFFLIIYIATGGHGMGLGDVKFAFVLGFVLGFPNTIVALYSAFLTGAVVSLILIAWGKKKFRKDTIPFGPFLVLGIVVASCFGNQILSYLPFPFG